MLSNSPSVQIYHYLLQMPMKDYTINTFTFEFIMILARITNCKSEN